MARLFITGATGFVGAATLRAAIAAGHDVVAPIRPGGDAWRLAPYVGRFTPIEADLRDSAAVARALQTTRPEAVVHLGWSGVGNAARFDRSQITDNVESSCKLLEAAAAAGCQRFIGFGSQGEYGPLNRRIVEDDLPAPTTLYGAAKLATLQLTRQLAAQAGMQFGWLRLFSAFGPEDNENWLIPFLIREMLAGRRPQTTLGTQYWDWLFIDDCAQAIIAVVEAQAEGVFNLGSGKPVMVRHVVEALRDLAAPGMELVFGEVPFRPDQIMHMEADISRITAATTWRPRTSLEEGLAMTVAWHRRRLQP